MIPRQFKKTFKFHEHLLCRRNINQVKIEHVFNSKCLHQLHNQDQPNSIDVRNDTFPLQNVSKTTNVDNPHYLSCIHQPLTINLQKTDSGNGGRKYLSKYPSVTTVLSNTKPSSEFFSLMQWRKANIEKLGKEKFGVMQRNTTTKGTNFHQEMKTYFSSMNNGEYKDNNLEASGFFQSVINVLPNITNPLAIESAVVHSQLGYAGTVDLVAEYLGKISIIDWKTSLKKRAKLKDLYSYPLQLAAYAGAINYDADYPFQISNGVLVVAYENGDPADIHILDEKVLEEFWDKWLLRLNVYKEKYKEIGDIKDCYSNEPTNISTIEYFDPSKNVPKGGFTETNKDPISAAPNVYGTREHFGEKPNLLSNGSGLNGVNFSSVQNCGTSLNELGKRVKDEEVIASWKSLSGLMESIFGKAFLSKGLLMSHYIKTAFSEFFKTFLVFATKTKKQQRIKKL